MPDYSVPAPDDQPDYSVPAPDDVPGPTIKKAVTKAGQGSHSALLDLPEDLQMEALGFDKPTVAKIKAHPDFKPGMVDSSLRASGMPGTTQGNIMQLPVVAQLYSLAKGVSRLGQGTVQAIRNKGGFGESDPMSDLHNRLGDYQYESTTGTQPGTGIGEFIGSTISTPSLGGVVGKGIGASIKAIPRLAAEGAVQAYLQPVANANQDYGTQKALQVGIGATLSPIASLTVDKIIGKTISKMKNAREGNLDALALKVMAEAKASEGMNLNASTILDRIRKLHPELEQVKTSIGKAKSKFEQLLESGGRGTDAGKLIQEDIGNAADAESKTLQGMYQKRNNMAKHINDMDFPQLRANIDEKVAKLQKDPYNVEENAKEVQALLAFKDRMTPRAEVKGTAPRHDEYGLLRDPGITPLPGRKISFEQGDIARSSIGQELTNYYKGAGVITGKPGADVLGAMKAGLSADLDKGIEDFGTPELKEFSGLVKTKYSKYKDLFGDKEVIALREATSPNEVAKTLTTAGPEKAQKIYNILTPAGQAAYRKNIVDEALGNFVNESDGSINPGMVAKAIADREAAIGVTMNAKDQRYMKGFKNTMQAIQGGNATSSTDEFRNAAKAAGGIRGLGATATGLYQIIADKGADAMFNSDGGKRFLFAMSTLDPKSSKANALINSFLSGLRKTPTILGSQAIASPLDVNQWMKSHPEYQ